jgi:hypothetical protein
MADSQDKKSHEFAEILNLIELSCAIYKEKILVGSARDIYENYVEDVLLIIEKNDERLRELERFIHKPNTFENIKFVRRSMRGKYRRGNAPKSGPK